MVNAEDADYYRAGTFLEVMSVFLMIIVLFLMLADVMTLGETFRRRKRWDMFDRQAMTFQLLLFGISLANAFLLTWFILGAAHLADRPIPCDALTKLMGAGYLLSIMLSYMFFILRARLAGRMFNVKMYWRWSRCTEIFVGVFAPCILLPIFLTSPEGTSVDPDGHCLLNLPLYLLIVFLIGNLIISCNVIALFIYPLLATARDAEDINRPTSRMFLDLAKFNARLSIVAVISTSVAVIIFCTLDYLASRNHEQDYLIMIAHGISLIDIVGLSVCIRTTIRVWVPSFLKKKVGFTSAFTSSAFTMAPSPTWMQRPMRGTSPAPATSRIVQDPPQAMENATVTTIRRATPVEATVDTPLQQSAKSSRRITLRLPLVRGPSNLAGAGPTSPLSANGTAVMSSGSSSVVTSMTSEEGLRSPMNASMAGEDEKQAENTQGIELALV